MMNFAISIICIEITGLFLAVLLVKGIRYKCSLGELLSLSFFIGIFAASSQLFLYFLLDIPFDLKNIIPLPLMCLGGLAGIAVYGRGKHCDIHYERRPFVRPGKLEMFLIACIVLQLLWVSFLAMSAPVHSHDAVANYALKAKIFYFEKGIPAGFLSWPEAAVAHPDYPPMLPLLMTWVYEFMGFDDLAINAIMPLVYAVFLVLAYSLFRKFFSRLYSVISVFVIASVPQVADYATVIHTDLFLMVFAAAGFIYLVLYMKEGKTAPLVLSAVFFGISLWLKNEAAVFAGSFIFVLFLFTVRRLKKTGIRGLIPFAVALVILAAIAASWFIVKAGGGAVNNDINMVELTPARVWQNVKDIPVLLDLFQQQVFGPKKWNILWVLVLAAAIWKWRDLVKPVVRYQTLFLAISVAGYFAGYMLTTGNNLFFYVNTTISRFMIHFAGIAVFFTVTLLPGAKKNVKGKYVFFDRDGVINKDGDGWTEYGYITRWKDLHFLPGVLKALKKLADAGFRCVIISNQQGVGKGYFSERDLSRVTEKMVNAIAHSGGDVAGVFYCRHRKEERCGCRKPKEGLFYQAAEKLDIDGFEGMYYLGDAERDVQAGKKVGMGTMIILSGKTKVEDIKGWEYRPDRVFTNLNEAVDFIIQAENKKAGDEA